MRAWLSRQLRQRGFVWYRKPALPWGLDLRSDLQRWFDLDAFRCIVDVGAHVGTMSLEFAAMCPRAEVVAFEMVPATFEQLQRNVRAVGRIQPHCIGLADESGQAAIALEQDSQLHSLRPPAPGSGASSVVVQVRRLDELAAELGIASIDLLKVDAEGFDLQVMKGASALFRAGKVRAVLVEVDFGHSSREHGNFQEITAWLGQWRLRLVGFYDGLVLERDGVPYLDYTNALYA